MHLYHITGSSNDLGQIKFLKKRKYLINLIHKPIYFYIYFSKCNYINNLIVNKVNRHMFSV